jgi:hypothetical protein
VLKSQPSCFAEVSPLAKEKNSAREELRHCPRSLNKGRMGRIGPVLKSCQGSQEAPVPSRKEQLTVSLIILSFVPALSQAN